MVCDKSQSNMSYYVIDSRLVDKIGGLRCDQTIRLNTSKAMRDYPKALRRIHYYDDETMNWL